MVISPMSGVLPGFPSAAYSKVRLNENPCAALLIKKNGHFFDRKLTIKHFENI
jgi:hypothetical protein